MRSRHRDARSREPQRRLDECRPRQSPVRAPQLVEPGGQAGHRARRCADRVVHELLAERHLELRHRRAGAGRHRDEAVEVARLTGCRVEVDRVAAAEQARHHGLRDTRRERRRDGGVGGIAAGGEDLDAGLGGGRVPGGDRRDHGTRRASRLPKRAKPSSGKSKRSRSASPPTISNVVGPIGRAVASRSSVCRSEAFAARCHRHRHVLVLVGAAEPGERRRLELDGRCDAAPGAEQLLEPGVLDVAQRLAAEAAVRQCRRARRRGSARAGAWTGSRRRSRGGPRRRSPPTRSPKKPSP